MTEITSLCAEAKKCTSILMNYRDRNALLIEIADDIEKNSKEIIDSNLLDLENGKKNGLSESLLDRLKLDEQRIKSISDGIRNVSGLSDPLGRVLSGQTMENGLKITKITVPIGLIALIYEARPNVTADAAALCLKSGNCVVLRGGKEAINSNKKIVEIIKSSLVKKGLPAECVQLVTDTTRESAEELMQMTDYVDVLIPRGGAQLIKSVVKNSKVPVIETGAGNCHIYVDLFADLDMATNIIFNAKTSRPSVCNAVETVLIHESIAKGYLPMLKKKLDEKSVKIHGCERTKEILGDEVILANEDDWENEYLNYEIAIKVVKDIDDAIEHISKYSTGHSEAIITINYNNAQKFINYVDSAAVYVNASTRFTDGGEFGLGAEIGISTQKIHARGPMGLNELVTTKYIIEGSGQIR